MGEFTQCVIVIYGNHKRCKMSALGPFTSIPRCPRHLRCSLNRCHDVAARRTVRKVHKALSALRRGTDTELDDELASNRRIVMNARADRYPRTVPAADPHGATDVRLRSDEPQADQHQYAGQDGEQEAI